jgi:cytochrome b pre-mRNA-processing protein 3
LIGRDASLFARLFRADRAAEAAAVAAYGAIVAQARSPALYAGLGVPDSVTGRFEMVVLHTILVIGRLRQAGPAGTALSQLVFDSFCRDMDQSLRELGFGDMAVPKRMKKLGESFYGRAEAYGRTLTDRKGLAAAIQRNVFPDGATPASAGRLADYAIAAAAALADVPLDRIGAGAMSFPDPAAFVEAET